MFQAVQLLSTGLTFRDHRVRVKAATLEPHGDPRTNQLLHVAADPLGPGPGMARSDPQPEVHWNNIDGTGFHGKLWR